MPFQNTEKLAESSWPIKRSEQIRPRFLLSPIAADPTVVINFG